jgi:hypothetical protein
MAIEFDLFDTEDCGPVDVFGVEYTVMEVGDLHDGEEKLSAAVDLPACIIYVDNNQDNQAKTAAVCHEVVHIWDHHLSLGLTEEQVNAIGSLMHGVLQDVGGDIMGELMGYRRAWVQLFDELRTVTKYGDHGVASYPGHEDVKERMVAISEEHGISVWEEDDN